MGYQGERNTVLDRLQHRRDHRVSIFFGRASFGLWQRGRKSANMGRGSAKRRQRCVHAIPAIGRLTDVYLAVLFSREPSHALSEVQLISPDASLRPTEDVKLRNDGWVVIARVDGDQLLFWVPVEQRDVLILPVRKTILGGKPSELDLANFAHGPNWVQCYLP